MCEKNAAIYSLWEGSLSEKCKSDICETEYSKYGRCTEVNFIFEMRRLKENYLQRGVSLSRRLLGEMRSDLLCVTERG